jgi:hypothetical protein
MRSEDFVSRFAGRDIGNDFVEQSAFALLLNYRFCFAS